MVWVMLLLLFFVDRRANKLEKPELARRGGVVQHFIRTAGEHADVADPQVLQKGDSVRVPARQPKTAEPSAPGTNSGVKQRGFLLPPLEPSGPGEMGKPVKLEVAKLPKKGRDAVLQGWNSNAFNQYVSDMISVHRTLPDVRDSK